MHDFTIAQKQPTEASHRKQIPKLQVETIIAALIFSVGLSSISHAAASDYPKKPITIVSPYSAGGNADLAARSLAAAAAKHLGQPVIVLNRAGAGGTIGSRFVVDAPKDGYTLLLARVGSQAIAPAIDPTTPYAWNDFSFVSVLELDPYVCVVPGNSPFQSFAALLSAIEKDPGKLSYGVSGNADGSVVFPLIALQEKNLPPDAALKIPYKSGGEVSTAVLGGHVDFACTSAAGQISAIQSGKVKALLVTTSERIAAMPDTPTAQEIGMQSLEAVSGWSALYGPPGLPEAVISKWTTVLGEVSKDPRWREQVAARNSVPALMSLADTTQFIRDQFQSYRALAPKIDPK